jgi:transposase
VIELPLENIRRRTVRRKAAIVDAVNAGEVTREEICSRYQVSIEEFLSWQHNYENHGLAGLRSTRMQIYRRLSSPKGPDRR